jgi:uncharacterized membrane protein YphA (DoxX/SURF4 family)
MSLTGNFKQNTYLGYIALVRIFVGYHFLGTGLDKLDRFLRGRPVLSDLARGLSKDPLALHRAFIAQVVIPHDHFFGYLVMFGELAIAASLLSGCLVRISSSFGAFHNANILLAIGWAGGGAVLGINRIFILLHLIFVFSSAGRAVGIDGFLHKWFPRSWLF